MGPRYVLQMETDEKYLESQTQMQTLSSKYITYVSIRTNVRRIASFIGKCVLSSKYSVRINLILSLIKVIFQHGESKNRKKLYSVCLNTYRILFT